VTLPVVWLAEADADAKDAQAWYEAVRSDLGEQFAWAIDTTVEAIRQNPRRFPVVHRDRRRAGVRRFPYGLFCDVQEHRIVVTACFHARRNPRSWQIR
jgi:plasmid stabilization system protein ParE